MWEFPHGELKPNESLDSGGRRVLQALTGLRAKIGAELLTLKHTVTRYRITLTGVEARCVGGRFHSSVYIASKWVSPEELESYPVSSPQRKLARSLASFGQDNG
jgi:hypothetical protein